MNPRFEIVATVGPASRSLAAELYRAGASALRLNASHMNTEELGRMALHCRECAPDAPIVVDLKGAKMRLGGFEPRKFSEGERLKFSLVPGENVIPVPHPQLFRSVSEGETLGCDDDRLRFRVLSFRGDTIEATALCPGTLLPYKGINIVEHPLHLQRLTSADQAAISATSGLAPVSYAFSFMEDGREAAWVRERAPACQVIGKVERREAAANFRTIAAAVDALWICRGDLGAQLGLPGMAQWVAGVEPLQYELPVLMAGQVLEHLTAHASPTRAEVCHVFDLCRRGYTGFVLSDETAIGRDPAGTVRFFRSLLDSF